MPKANTIKYIAKKVANNGDENDYVKTPLGADSDNVDRPDGSTVEESLTEIENSKGSYEGYGFVKLLNPLTPPPRILTL